MAVPRQESKPPDYLLGPWRARPRFKGRERFVLVEDPLWLSLLYLRRSLSPVAWAVLWAIVMKQLTEHHKGRPVPIEELDVSAEVGFDELAEVLGCSRRAVIYALDQLEALNIIRRVPGGGGRLKSAYWVLSPDEWLH